MRHTPKYLLHRVAFYFGGDQPSVSWRERLRSCVGAFVGLLFVLTIAKVLGGFSGIDEWLMASLGASALLVFALPASPMAQPWAVIAGNTLSALVGITAAILIDQPLLAMPVAVSFFDYGYVYLALPSSACSSSCLNCYFGPCYPLPICALPSND